jgi:hypothetical protein
MITMAVTPTTAMVINKAEMDITMSRKLFEA